MFETATGIILFFMLAPFLWIVIGLVDIKPFSMIAVTWSFAVMMGSISIVRYLRDEKKNS